mmetsp:Transcript_39246/g.90158  ORF Transcript_39246/g.90158 Transcript_39246/m.90158 type:complete len:233 (-) Transcript_39246:10-708(-)
MATARASNVRQHAVQNVRRRWVSLCGPLSHEAVEAQQRRELELTLQLAHVSGAHVVVEPLEVHEQHGGERLEAHAPPRLLPPQVFAPRVVRVRPGEHLLAYKLAQRRLERRAAVHLHLQIAEALHLLGGEVDLGAAGHAADRPLEQRRDAVAPPPLLQARLQRLAEHPRELVDVLLDEHILRAPAEALGEALRADVHHAVLRAVLQLEEHPLQLEGHPLLRRAVDRGGHVVD